METLEHKNLFYKSRSITGRLTASLSFINKNITTFFRLSLYILIPFGIFQGLFMLYNQTIIVPGHLTITDWIVIISGMIISFLFAFSYNSLIYTLIQKYAELKYIPSYKNIKEIKKPLVDNGIKLLITGILLFFVFCFLIALFAFLAGVSPFTLIVTIPLFLALIIPCVYWAFIYILDNVKLGEALKKSFRIGFRYWGSTLTVLILTSIITGIIQLISMLPSFLITMVAGLAQQDALQQGEASNLPGFFPVILFIITIISIVLSCLSTIIATSAIAFQYGNIEAATRERIEIENAFH